MKIYNWGILGAGAIARKFASDLKLLPNANLLAIGSNSYERARTFADEFDVKHCYGSYQELVDDEAIDVIYIASRHVGHYQDTLLCLNHGKAVLCEKPVAMNQAQFERMVEAAKKNQIFFMEALWTRFLPSFIECIDIIERGEIGEIRLIESDFCFNHPYDPEHRLYNPLLGGGALLDIGIYPLFAALEVGGDIKQMKAMASVNSDGIDTSSSILLQHKSGIQSILFCSIETNGRVETIFHGSRGMLKMNKWWHVPTSLELIRDDRDPLPINFDESGNGYRYEAAEVMKCLDRGDIESSLHSWAHSRRLISNLDAIRNETGISYPEEIEMI